MKRVFAAICAGLLLLSSLAMGEEILEEVSLDEEILAEEAGQDAEETGPEDGDPAAVSELTDQTVFTPSYSSAYPGNQGHRYWTMPMDITDEAAVWEMLMEPMTVVDIGKKSGEKVQTYLYREPDEKSKPIGVVTCESQGVRVIETLDNGWSLVECYSSSFHDTKVKAWNILVSGYIKTSYLKEVTPNQHLAIVIDKLSQRLYLFQDGKLLSTLLCATGLTAWNGKKYQPYNETRSGEFFLMSRAGTLVSDRLLCSYAIRFNSGDMIHEVPHVDNKDGTPNYKSTEPKLGTKCSHGCIRVQRLKSPEGINMKWIYSQVKSNRSLIKIVIWEDWQGRQLPIPDGDTTVYYNPEKGSYYHSVEHCYSAPKITFTPFRYDQLEEPGFSKLEPCPNCNPPRRVAEIQEVNQRYAPGGDHDELLTRLRAEYYEYLKAE